MMSQIVISLAALFGLFQLFRITDVFSKAIILAQALAVVIALFPFAIAKTIGFSLFGIMILTSAVYVLTRKIELTAKGLMLLITIPVFLSFVFKINHWPYAYEFSLLMLVPIIAYLILITRKISIKNEIGFLTIIATEALLELSVIVSYWLNL
ncbi:MAG: hypothetical protein COA33_009210 [Fluviicola sp.]|nr:hypothetical protein [Fluviicola sp.]